MINDSVMGTDAYSILVPDGWKLDSNIAWDGIKPIPLITISETDASQHATWKHYPRTFYVDGIRENYIRLFPNRQADIEKAMAEGQQTAMGDIIHKLPNSPREYLEQIFIPPAFRKSPRIKTPR
jgi:hypothetical protein